MRLKYVLDGLSSQIGLTFWTGHGVFASLLYIHCESNCTVGEGLFRYMYCKRLKVQYLDACLVVGKLSFMHVNARNLKRYRLLCLRCKVNVNIFAVSISKKLRSSPDWIV